MNNKKKEHKISYLVIIIAFFIFWPLGVILLLYKLGVFDSILAALTSNANKTLGDQELRMQKYKIITAGHSSESIAHLAAAVGISQEACLRDLQIMLNNGDFGPDAYINYLEKTLVLRGSSSSTGVNINSSNRVKTAKYEPAEVKTSKSKKPSRKGSDKLNPYGTASVALLAFGILLAVAAFGSLANAVDYLVWLGFSESFTSSLIYGIFYAAGAAVSFGVRGKLRSRTKRMTAYTAALAGHEYMSLSELASVAGVSVKTVTKDIEVMIEKGLLGEEAYIDQGDSLLILRTGAGPEPQAEPETPAQDEEDRYRAILREIQEVNDEIPDPELTKKISEIQSLTASIFKAVEDNPSKLPQIRSFMSYYLPTTLKLLHSYADFDKNGADGSNVRAAKADIENILDMLESGFRKQLDKLYEADAIDISSDIDVLEDMLRRDGLSSDGSGFGTMSSGGR